MIMAIEVSAMTGRTVLTAGCPYCTAGQGAGAGSMTGSTRACAMGLESGRIRCGGCRMAVNTQGHGVHAMSMIMGIEVSRMTGRTGATTVIGQGGAIDIVHRRRMGGRGCYRTDQVITRVNVTAGAVVMDQVTSGCIYRHIVCSNRSGGRMTVGAHNGISYQSAVITIMTGGRVMTGGRTVIAR